ncbi:hypothetical protein THIOM_004555 [Candidatus Thiomargarita nelsonii]|uniref:Uncharacterized protein n=1 Tax=Candidatus Thiomargarita nelsonii TaxID=1003181 RepID=A0A176RVN7_9GAMM|nr:hypothetical protein THIOM_004555 [Candidatus Thiomargarita nelsonii]
MSQNRLRCSEIDLTIFLRVSLDTHFSAFSCRNNTLSIVHFHIDKILFVMTFGIQFFFQII